LEEYTPYFRGVPLAGEQNRTGHNARSTNIDIGTHQIVAMPGDVNAA
jgi:hypothetical protein